MASIRVNSRKLRTLTKFFERSERKIIRQIRDSSLGTIKHRNEVLKQVRDEIAVLKEVSENYNEQEIPKMYLRGYKHSDQQLGRRLAVKGFSLVNKRAIEYLILETNDAIAESMTVLYRDVRNSMSRVLREEVKARIAEGILTGETRKKIASELRDEMTKRGVIGLIDKRGAKWSLTNYTEMLYRTKMVEAHTAGVVNRALESGVDLVQVSRHSGACPLCTPWEGRILSITGEHKKYPSLEDARSEGLYHANCRHRLDVYRPEIARLTKKYRK